MSHTNQLRWGFLSTAKINNALISPLRHSQRNKLIAVASRSDETARQYAQEHHIPRYFASYDAMLADPEIDVVYNSLPNHLHAEWTIKALEAGKHVLCEKPFALTLSEVDSMIAAARKTGKVLTEAFMYRTHPQTLDVQRMVELGSLGKILMVDGTFTFTLNRPGNYRSDPAMGGGSLWDVGCYPVSYARMIFGTEPVEVFGWQVLGESGIDETFMGQMRFPGDVFAQFSCGFRAPYHTRIEIIGSEGVLEIPVPFSPRKHEKIHAKYGDYQTINVTGQDLYLGEVEDMADAVLLGKAPRISLEDSRANIATILALYESARVGKPIPLAAQG